MHSPIVMNMSVSSLKPRAKNPRTHSKKQIKQIADSIQKFGFMAPILVDDDNRIIAGHGRLEAAKLAGLSEVLVVSVDHLSDAETRAYLIVDNKIAENAGWDKDLLALELKELEIEKIEPLKLGFEPAEVDALAARVRALMPAQSDAIPAVETSKPAVSRRGDLWLIGPHRLLCGDALNPADYATLTAGEKMDCVFTDPPYNVPVKGHVSGKGKVQHREFAMASGEMSESEFTGFLRTVFSNLAQNVCDGALIYSCMDWRHMGEICAAAQASSLTLENLCVWVKSNGGMGSLYRSQHELVFVYKAGSGPHINNVALGKNGRNRTNVWSYPGAKPIGIGQYDYFRFQFCTGLHMC